MPVLASDTFTQTDGTVFSTSVWQNGTSPTGSRALAYGNTGVVSTGTTGTTAYNGANTVGRCFVGAGTNRADGEFSGRFRFVGQECYPQIWARSTNTSMDGTGGYAFSINPDGTWDLSRHVAGSGVLVPGAAGSYTMVLGRFFNFRFKVAGTLLQSKIWMDGTAEPAYPAVGVATSQACSATDSGVSAAGYWGFVVLPGAGPTVIAPVAGISGLPWNSGVFAENGSGQLASSDSFGTYRGRRVDNNVYFANRTQATLAFGLGELPDGTNGTPNLLQRPGYCTIAVPTQPEGSSVTAGTGSGPLAFWTSVGASIVSKGFNVPNKIIYRLSWEYNIPSFSWRTNNPNTATYISAWQNCVNGIRAGGANNVLFNYCANKGPDQNGNVWTDTYPGDSFVDLIGLDWYDQFNASFNSTDFANEKAWVAGWNACKTFALAHGKRMWINEWGVSHWPGGVGGGDNPYFIEAMWNLFMAESGDGGVLAGEDYFNHFGAQAGSTYLEHQLTEGHNPNASATYADLSRWGGN